MNIKSVPLKQETFLTFFPLLFFSYSRSFFILQAPRFDVLEDFIF
jgi:hypothetical protein